MLQILSDLECDIAGYDKFGKTFTYCRIKKRILELIFLCFLIGIIRLNLRLNGIMKNYVYENESLKRERLNAWLILNENEGGIYIYSFIYFLKYFRFNWFFYSIWTKPFLFDTKELCFETKQFYSVIGFWVQQGIHQGLGG
jgi:hypothetical protein